jgi:tetratricopeptide (TPR) repeat protein
VQEKRKLRFGSIELCPVHRCERCKMRPYFLRNTMVYRIAAEIVLFLPLVWAVPVYPASVEPGVEDEVIEGNWDSAFVLLHKPGEGVDEGADRILLDQIRIMINCDCSWQSKRPRSYSEEEIREFDDWAADLRNRSPRNSYVLFMSAVASLLSKDQSAASRFLDRSLELRDDNIASLILKGAIFEYRGEYQQAIDYLTSAIKIDSLNAYAYKIRGKAFLTSTRFGEAIADLSRAIELGDDDPINFHNRANAYKDSGEHAMAVADYTEAIRRDSAFRFTYFSRGDIYYSSKLSSLAYDDYRKFLELTTPTKATYIPSADLARVRHFVDTASVSSLQAGDQLSDPDYWLRRASDYVSNSDWTRAMACYLKAMELDSTRYESYLWRGYIFDKLGHPHRAMADLNRAVAMAPHAALVYRTRAESYLNRFIKSKESEVPEYREKQAIADFNQALTIQPDDLETHYFRALTYDLIDDTVKATSDFKFVIKNATPADSFKVRMSKKYLDGYTK